MKYKIKLGNNGVDEAFSEVEAPSLQKAFDQISTLNYSEFEWSCRFTRFGTPVPPEYAFRLWHLLTHDIFPEEMWEPLDKMLSLNFPSHFHLPDFVQYLEDFQWFNTQFQPDEEDEIPEIH